MTSTARVNPPHTKWNVLNVSYNMSAKLKWSLNLINNHHKDVAIPADQHFAERDITIFTLTQSLPSLIIYKTKG